MSEKICAKDLYRWKQGMDDYNIKVLSALNNIIDGLAALEDGDWAIITETIGSSSMCDIAKRCSKIYSSDELMDIADNFEAIRTLLFGDKIDYKNLLEVLRENVDKCGWTEEKKKQEVKEKYKKLEEKRRALKEKYEGSFSTEMPERIKNQWEEIKKSENSTSEGGDDNG